VFFDDKIKQLQYFMSSISSYVPYRYYDLPTSANDCVGIQSFQIKMPRKVARYIFKRRQQQRPGRNQYRIVHSRSERLESTASTLFDSPDRHAEFVFTNTNSCRVSRMQQQVQANLVSRE
jgi:hypothetical protein